MDATVASMLSQIRMTLAKTWASYRKHHKIILGGSLILAVIIALLQGALAMEIEKRIGSIVEGMDIDPLRLEELTEQYEGDPEGLDAAFSVEFGDTMAKLDAMTEEERTAYFQEQSVLAYRSLGLFFLASFILTLCLSILSVTYFFIVMMSPSNNWKALAHKTVTEFFPMLIIFGLVILLSGGWIPVLGIISILIIVPRIMFAPALHLQEHSGIIQSLKLSYHRTKGEWKIYATHLVVMGILTFVLFGAAQPFLHAINAHAEWFALFVELLILQLVFAFNCGYIVQLLPTLKLAPAKK